MPEIERRITLHGVVLSIVISII